MRAVSRVVPSGSRLYGTTVIGGAHDDGIVFSLAADGTDYQVLHSFDEVRADYRPYGAPIVSGSTLFGQTLGTVYTMNTDGTNYHVLAYDAGGLGKLTLIGSTLYGMSQTQVFSMQTDGTEFHVLHDLDGITQSGLTAIGSTLYGVTRWGGSQGQGSIFSINTDGSDYQILHDFVGGDDDGSQPLCDLIAIGSTLYGTTGTGGPNGAGMVFALTVPEPSALLPASQALLAMGLWRCSLNFSKSLAGKNRREVTFSPVRLNQPSIKA